jgi:hypothetical protein
VSSCFPGQVRGFGLHGTTRFHAGGVQSTPSPTATPGWTTYSGLFEYTSAFGIVPAEAASIREGD